MHGLTTPWRSGSWYPRCAVCDKPVERVDVFTDPMTGEHVVQAHCHGASEESRIPSDITHLSEIVEAVAFRAPLRQSGGSLIER